MGAGKGEKVKKEGALEKKKGTRGEQKVYKHIPCFYFINEKKINKKIVIYYRTCLEVDLALI